MGPAASRAWVFRGMMIAKVCTGIRAALQRIDVLLWYYGLKSVAPHLDRVNARVRRGGHDIPEEEIRERWVSYMDNPVALIPKS